ncbi:pitrilysin family protein [soil metagenome]
MRNPPRLPEIAFTKTTLDNGLDVIVRRQAHLPIVAVNLWYHVGSKNEEPRRHGFAHLFEHLMFEGSEHYPGDFFKPLQRLGAHVNCSTSPYRTNYFEDLPAAHIELALAMESDRMGHLLPALSEEKLRIQKNVVQNEFRQNYANRPYGQVFALLAEALYPPDHPYHWLTIGAMEDVEAATRADVETFFRRYYVPSNASLCLVGDLEIERGLELAERYFGPIAGGAPALRPRTPSARLDRDVEIQLREPVELDRVYLAWHTVEQFHDDDAAIAILADLLGQGRSARLYRRLVMERGIAQDVTAYQSSRELAGTFGAIATMRPGHPWQQAQDIIDEEIQDLAIQGPDPEELARVQNSRLGGFLYALDNVGGFGGVADRLNAYNVYLGDPGRITSDVDRYQGVNADDIRRVASRYLDRERSRGTGGGNGRVRLTVLGRGRGRGRGASVARPPLDRSARPTGAAAVPFRAPLPEQRTLKGGMPLWVLPRRDLPIVAGAIAIPAGAGVHGPEQGGLASLTASLMDEGTRTRSALELANAAESMATSLSSGCGWDGSYVSFQCLVPHLEASLDLVADVLLNPTFPEREWERVRGQTIASLQAERDRADARAHRALLRALYGPDHPYRVPNGGELATVEKLSRVDLQRFHAEHYRPDRAAWIVAGDIDPDQIAEWLDERLGDWSGVSPARTELPGTSTPHRRRILLLHRPGAPQAVLRVGQVGIDRLDPDDTNLLVFNQILGGQFTSRLNTRLREEKGYTYGIRSQFDLRRGPGPFSITTSVQTDKAAEALVDLVRELEDLLGDRPPTATELDDARRSLIEGQARQFETPGTLVSRYAGLFLYDLPPDEHARFADRLSEVSIESLVAAASRTVRPSGLIAVVVADAELVAGQLERLGWAKIERIDEEVDL